MRSDVIWARTVVDGAITVDGVLNEPAWANAEAVRIQFGVNAGLPGSGWHFENTPPPTDPTDATVRFLVVGNELYLGVSAKDSSVGGGAFNRFDGILMNIRNKANPARPAPPFEYFYAWWDNDPNTLVKGAMPSYFGPVGGPRDPDKLQIWDAATTVDGITNSDTTADGGYTMEFRLNLTPRGYDVMRPEGDIISFNISIYDADWQWPVIPGKLTGNRVWFQGPFSAFVNNTVRIYARPDVTVNSGAVPEIGPEVIIPNAANYDAPTIDGQLNEAVWANAPSFDLKYGDDAVRQTYPSIGPIASGQFQPEVNGGRAAVVDPGDATFKYFFKDNKLYVGADVRDQLLVSLNTGEAQWDGIRFMILDRVALDVNNHSLVGHELVVRFDSTGKVIGEGDLATLGAASYAVSLKAGSTVNDFNNVDDGYFVELSVDLTQIGYPAGLGDGVAFIGALLFDGDSFPNSADDYGTRVWWFKERGNNASPVWAYMDPNTLITGVDEKPGNGLPTTFALIGNYPNPFNPSTTIRFAMPEDGIVTMKVYDILGRSVATIPLGLKQAGYAEASFDATRLISGVYFYRLNMVGIGTRRQFSTLYGKMMLLK
jgi:hypothetical protein